MNQIFEYRLRNATLSAKVMIGGFLVSLGLAYLYALANIAMVVGLTPKDISVHYYGAEKTISVQAVETGEQSLDLEGLEPKTSEVLGPRPSFKNLVQEGHFHLFGMTSFFFILTSLALFTSLSERIKVWVVGLPSVSIIFDNVSFMATRFGGPRFAYLTAFSGAMMGILFTLLWLAVGFEILKEKENL